MSYTKKPNASTKSRHNIAFCSITYGYSGEQLLIMINTKKMRRRKRRRRRRRTEEEKEERRRRKGKTIIKMPSPGKQGTS